MGPMYSGRDYRKSTSDVSITFKVWSVEGVLRTMLVIWKDILEHVTTFQLLDGKKPKDTPTRSSKTILSIEHLHMKQV